jgi:hypothetical protein
VFGAESNVLIDIIVEVAALVTWEISELLPAHTEAAFRHYSELVGFVQGDVGVRAFCLPVDVNDVGT